VNVDLTQERVARVNESMQRIRWDYDDAAGFYLALLVSDGDSGTALERECDFDVRMLVQRRALPGPGVDDVGGEGCAVICANEVIRHSHERQLLEIDEAHGIRESRK